MNLKIDKRNTEVDAYKNSTCRSHVALNLYEYLLQIFKSIHKFTLMIV